MKSAALKPPAPVQAASRRIGQTRTFSVRNETGRYRRVVAHLEAAGKHADIWVDRSQRLSQPSIVKLLDRLDQRIYPTDIGYFASPRCRGRLSRIAVLITDLKDIDGYFDSGDIEGQNHLNLIYLNSRLVKTEPVECYNTLAHEFSHLLFYCNGGADIEWLDEGMAVYAEYLNGTYPRLYVSDFNRAPYRKLTRSFSNNNNCYGAAFLFVAFAAEQVKQSHGNVPAFLQELTANSDRGVAGVNSVLHRYIANHRLDSVAEIYQVKRLKTFSSAAMGKN